MEIVLELAARLKERLGPERYDLWFGSSTRCEWTDNGLCVWVESPFLLERLRRSMLADIEAALQQATGRVVDVHFRVGPTEAAAPAPTPANHSEMATASDPSAAEPTAQTRLAGAVARVDAKPHSVSIARTLRAAAQTSTVRGPWRPAERPGRRFAQLNDFVIGECNQMGRRAVDLVLHQPGVVNPWFVHGPSGSGKTHLLEGLWSAVRARGGRRIVYLSAEQFTTYFLQALRGSGLPNFRQKYREVDLLILDDVQFFRGKLATISEVLYTMDALLRDGRQVVMSADRPPSELRELGSEWQTRVLGGLVCGLEPLDETTRRTVLQQMARDRALNLPDGTAERIARRAPGDARQLQGIVNRLWAMQEVSGEAPSGTRVEQVLDEYFPGTGAVVRLDDIERVVCDEFGIDAQTLRSDRRGRQISHPRMLAMWLARKHTRAALTEIGEYFGRRSHSTVVAAQQQVEKWLQDGRSLAGKSRETEVPALVQRLERLLRA